ncbi:NAPDH-dependent diflavin reductase [Ophidiomyces ophidiicola]|nr:NAPDH-dependent diflavin reductase [Ophidiomyces ophidiicola]KAI2211997.1 NAPDH-dependent diflavin reductase [Ophidiomyces ophidiicola]
MAIRAWGRSRYRAYTIISRKFLSYLREKSRSQKWLILGRLFRNINHLVRSLSPKKKYYKLIITDSYEKISMMDPFMQSSDILLVGRGMATYSQRYLKKTRVLPKLSAIPFEMNLFPKELWSTLDPKYVGLPGGMGGGFGALSRTGQKRGFEDDEDDAVDVIIRKRRNVDEEDDEGSDIDRRKDTEDEAALDDDDAEGEEEIVDDDFEEDEEDMGGDYNAEQYFDAGDEADDYGDGDAGDGDHYVAEHLNRVTDMACSENAIQRTALVIYASETGNSQEIAEELSRLTERLYFQTDISELDAVKAEVLNKYSLTILAVSTTGQGDLPANGRLFWRSLLLKRLPNTFLHQANFAIFGLGDSSYPKFNWAARKLLKRLLQLGANEIFPSGEADEQHPEGTEGCFVPWAQALKRFLLDKFPLKPGEHPIPEDTLLPPKWIVTTYGPKPSEADQTSQVGMALHRTAESVGSFVALQPEDHDTRPIPNAVPATLIENTRVTPMTHWQDVRHLVFTIPNPIPYRPGDVLHITPKNFTNDVNALLSLMDWESDADIPLCFVPGAISPSPSPTAPIPVLQHRPGFTLRELLTNYLDIMAIPRRSFFSQIAHFTSDEMHKDRLLEFTNPEYIDEYYDYATRSRRSILEVLYEFDTIKIPWQQVCTVFPVMRGRQFSISSGGKMKQTPNGGTRFDLLVAIVKYQTVIKKIREGVCTRYLAILQPGSTLKVQLHRGALSSSVKQFLEPSVLIGPGTGIAPIRSLLWEKAAIVEAHRKKYGQTVPSPVGPVILLFGGRNQTADYFFREDWEELGTVLDLTVFTAFSRDQKQKIYVQDVIRQNKNRFFQVLHDMQGAVFICGSSGRMPQAVREALIEMFETGGRLVYNRQEAEGYLMDMEKVGRYKQETW